jgi:2-polyprenyl-3-methyl-5-hydroxy-6-metoxy-1,4-benzoquinol methylase
LVVPKLPSYQRILFVGNGLGMLPRLFAHRGFQALVIDFSEVANHFCRQNPDGDRLKYNFFSQSMGAWFIELQRLSDEQIRQVLDPQFVPGGSVDYTTADVFECHFAEAHFDAIVMQNMAEH